MRSRTNGGVIGAFAYPTQNYANGVFFIHDAAIYNTGANPIWPLSNGLIYSASGGTISYAVNNSNYKLHTFTANSTFTVSVGSAQLEILIVAGGGSGGGVNSSGHAMVGGGGGGGGVSVITTWVNGPTTFTVEVGPGTGTPASASTQIKGYASKVTSTAGHNYISYGGAAGGYVSGTTAVSPQYGGGYGSGGGGCWDVTNGSSQPGSSGTAGQGFAGGTYGSTSSGNSGGGGGGADQVGYAGNYTFNTVYAGRGGDGYQWPRTGYYYGAGGGAGKTSLSANKATGGLSGSGTTTQGTGGYGSAGLGITTPADVSTTYYYGVGGGGSVAITTETHVGAAGGPGTVIFCYRYK